MPLMRIDCIYELSDKLTKGMQQKQRKLLGQQRSVKERIDALIGPTAEVDVALADSK